jgi:PAS domain S-box-containing protein
MRCKQDEKSLQESEECYKAIFDISLDGIFVITPDGTILAANPAACQMFGMTEEELIQAGIKKVVDTSDPRLKSLLKERDRTGRFKGELNHRRKDGTIFPCEISSAFFKDKDDLMKGVIIIRDISERKQTEEVLHAPEESYCSLLNTIDEGFCIIEIVEDEANSPLDFRFVETNPAFAIQSGVNDVVGKTIRQAFPQEPDEWIDIYDTVLNSGKSIRFERIFASQERMLDLYVFRIEDKTYRRVGVIFKDITKRKRAEEILKTTLQRFYTILSNMHGAILLVSEDGLIEFVNNIFCQYFDLSEQPADLVGITASEMIKKICNVYSDPDRAIAQIKEIIEMWEPVIGEEVELTGGRTCIRDFIPLSISGKTYGRLWYHIDITERKKAEKALKKAYDTLEGKVKERTAELQKAFELLKKNENDLAEAQRIARLGNWEWDIVTDKIYWSEEVYRIFGRSPKEFDTTYMSFLSFIHPEDRNNINNAVTETLSGKPYSIDYRVIQASGEERVVHAHGEASFGGDNNPVRLFGTVQDITDRKRDEETLRKSEKRYRLLHDNLRDAFAEVTIDGQIIDFNDQFYEILGYSSDEIRTLTYKDLEPIRKILLL